MVVICPVMCSRVNRSVRSRCAASLADVASTIAIYPSI
jgi:hypothetical protein